MKNELHKLELPHLKVQLIFLVAGYLISIIVMTVFWLIDQMPTHIYLSILLGLTIIVTLLFFYLRAYFKHFSYYMDERGLFINKGVFWQRKIVVPINRVQHTDITQGPIARKYNLSELTVHTAGTSNSSVKIEGILNENASELRSQLSFNESEDAV